MLPTPKASKRRTNLHVNPGKHFPPVFDLTPAESPRHSILPVSLHTTRHVLFSKQVTIEEEKETRASRSESSSKRARAEISLWQRAEKCRPDAFNVPRKSARVEKTWGHSSSAGRDEFSMRPQDALARARAPTLAFVNKKSARRARISKFNGRGCCCFFF